VKKSGMSKMEKTLKGRMMIKRKKTKKTRWKLMQICKKDL
jgi:hypothetical protein